METIELPIGASSPKQQLVVDTFEKVQLLLIGGAMGSGKSYLLQMLSTMLMDDPDTVVYMYRETLGELEGGGGLVDTCKSVYNKLKDIIPHRWGRINKAYPALFAENGAKIVFSPMQYDKDKEKARGLQFTMAGIDEANHFSKVRIEMIMSRLRSKSRHHSRAVLTCNPDPDHFLCELIKDYYLDDNGDPIQERAGHIRYLYRKSGSYYWANSREELGEQFDIPKEKLQEKILSFSFIPMTIYDNPDLLNDEPGYLANLEAMDDVEKARNLYGNWFARSKGSGVFERNWIRGEKGERVKKLIDIPKNCIAMRGVDKAYQLPSEENPSPDYTALSPLILKDKDGFYWLLGNYNNRITDEIAFTNTYKPIIGRFKKLAGERDNLIALQMKTDKANSKTYQYQEPKLVLAKDNGAGSSDYISTLARMVEEGIKVEKDTTISNVAGKKMQDFLAFTKACQDGLVFIVEETWDKDTLETWYSELEAFTGQRSNGYRKDDFVDSTSICFNCISTKKRPYNTPHVVPVNSSTLLTTLN